jgi:hypothetical protein
VELVHDHVHQVERFSGQLDYQLARRVRDWTIGVR